MLKPLSKRVVLQVIKEEEKKVGSLLLPESATTTKNLASVVAVASDVEDVKVDDKVIFEPFSTTEVKHDGKDYLIIEVKNILAVVE